MDKEITFSVAGSGKTSYLIEKLNSEKRFLIIVYTVENHNNIMNRIVKKFGYIPPNVVCYTYFSFLYSWAIKPFNIPSCPKIRKIDFENSAPRGFSKAEVDYYMHKDGIFHYRLYDFICQKGLVPKLMSRIERFFDCVLIDEVQDFSGNDFDFIMDLGEYNLFDLCCVGDFFQHIYDTSRNGSKNKNLHNSFGNYRKRFSKFSVNNLLVCFRCPEAICRFISRELGIPMRHYHLNEKKVVEPYLVLRDCEIKAIIEDVSIVKLIYSKCESFMFQSITWGKSKGLEFDNVCVILNKKTLRRFYEKKLMSLPRGTLNKFYVACSRTRGNLYFIDEERLSCWKVTGTSSSKGSLRQLPLPI